MASGSSDRLHNSGSKGFDFASDDNILSSYVDYANQEPSNGSHSDPVVGTNLTKDSQKGWMTGSFVFPPGNVFSSTEAPLNQEMVNAIERSMKKYTDNLMRFMEGIGSRLSQLELYYYNLDKSIGEMRSDLVHDHGDANSKLKSLEKHMQEVHRSVQILRDKQEPAQTQKEVAELQVAQKESSLHEEKAATVLGDSENKDCVPDTQLSLALPQQVAPLPSHPPRPLDLQQTVLPASQSIPQNISRPPPYYLPLSQLPNPPTQSQSSQSRYLPADQQFCCPQLAPPSSQGQVNQTPQAQLYPQYQQQWTNVPQPVQPQQPPSLQSQNQIRATSSALYPTYAPGQPTIAPPETHASSMPIQVPFSGISQPGAGPSEVVPNGYGGAGRPVQPRLCPQHMKNNFSVHPGDRYSATGPLPPTSGGGYMIYDSETGSHHSPQSPHFLRGGYVPANTALQNPHPPTRASLSIRIPSPAQYVCNHPYNELIDKLVGMGYKADHVASVIQSLEDGGQLVDFNAVLDGLNGHSSGGFQKGW